MAKLRKIEVAEETAAFFEAQAQERGQSVSDLLSEVAVEMAVWPEHLEKMRAEGRGPWSPESLAEDARRDAEFERTRMGVPWDEVQAWMRSWGKPNKLPMPKPRKV